MIKAENNSEWSLYLYYDETSPTGLRWINKRGKHGVMAGAFLYNKNLDKRTSVHVKFKQKAHKAHRIIWELFNGHIPDGMVIDHLNGDPWDNRIENLACKTRTGNSQNCKQHVQNKSGINGVTWRKSRTPTGTAGWHAYINCNGVRYEKLFSIYKYGDLAFEMAIEWRYNKIQSLNAQGAMFTERHKGAPLEQNN